MATPHPIRRPPLDDRLDRMTVGEAMHRGVLTCSAETTAVVAARVMSAHRVHSVLVVDRNGNCVGAVSDADVIAAMQAGTLTLESARGIGREPVCIEPTASLATAIAAMYRHLTTHLVVVEPETSRPIGVLSVLDVVDAVDEP